MRGGEDDIGGTEDNERLARLFEERESARKSERMTRMGMEMEDDELLRV